MSAGSSGARPAGRIAVVGAGIVGVRVARELVGAGTDGRGTARVVLVTRRVARRDQLRASFGPSVQVLLDEAPLPDDVSVVVVAREPDEQPETVRRHLREGRHVVSTADDPEVVADLLSLDAEARSRGRTVLVGAAMSPGLSCLLARHGAAELDRVDEVHVARHGAAGPACARQRLRALRGSGDDWRDGEWVRRPGFSGRELCWIPDPVSAKDCYRGALSEPALLVPAFPGVRRVTARLAASRRDRALAPFPVLVPPPTEGGLGAIRVELRGELRGERTSVVLGALDRPAVAAAGVAAVAALGIESVDLLPAGATPGAYGLASVGDPLPLLRELARRGVRAARFEGAGAPSDDVAGENTTESVQFRGPTAEGSHEE